MTVIGLIYLYILQSRNPNKEKHADVPVNGELTMQGVAVCVTHRF